MNSIVSRDLSIHQEHELLLKLEQAGMNSELAQKIIESKGNKIAKDFIDSISDEQDCKIISFEDNILTVELINPKSLIQLREQYGKGEAGFYDNNWWLDEDFAKDVPEPGIYVINVEKQLTNMTYNEQKEKLPEGWRFPHPAVIAQVILKHFEETGQRPLEDWYTRTSLTDSFGHHIYVGIFDSDGLSVNHSWDGHRISRLGAGPSRKSQTD